MFDLQLIFYMLLYIAIVVPNQASGKTGKVFIYLYFGTLMVFYCIGLLTVTNNIFYWFQYLQYQYLQTAVEHMMIVAGY